MPRVFADFENINLKYEEAIHSDQYLNLAHLCNKHQNIFVIANGGLHYVASHMATDMTRLIPDKVVLSFDSFGFITSTANDNGFDSIFENWLKLSYAHLSSALLVGLSCSGRSKNIISAFNYSSSLGWDSFLICGREPFNPAVSHLFLDSNHYHTVEALSLMLFYQLIHDCGSVCPSLVK